jgi:hypothetical protein
LSCFCSYAEFKGEKGHENKRKTVRDMGGDKKEGLEIREGNGGHENDHSILYACMKMSQ